MHGLALAEAWRDAESLMVGCHLLLGSSASRTITDRRLAGSPQALMASPKDGDGRLRYAPA